MDKEELTEKIAENEIAITLDEIEAYLIADGQFSTDEITNLLEYAKMVLETNLSLNLTAITDGEGFYSKHIIDSISLLTYLNEHDGENPSLLDIGSGAGFPGIPLKIMKKELKLVLLDSLNKRIKFMNTVVNELALKGAEAIHGRAEDLAHDRKYREKFDFVSARAVAKLPVLLELALPYVKVGGYFLAMKASEDEIKDSKKALEILGGEFVGVDELELPLNAGSRTIIKIKKVKPSPKKYPRQAGTPNKSPLV